MNGRIRLAGMMGMVVAGGLVCGWGLAAGGDDPDRKLQIVGPDAVTAGKSAQFHCEVVDSIGGRREVSSEVVWTIRAEGQTPAAKGGMPWIDEAGRLVTSDGRGNRVAVIGAEFGSGADKVRSERRVTIVDVAGSAGYALKFDGKKSFARVLNSAALEPDEITIEFWTQIEGPQAKFARFVRKNADQTDGGYLVGVQQGGDQTICFHPRWEAAVKDSQPFNVYAGEWHHIAAVYGKTVTVLYIDGYAVDRKEHSKGALQHDPHVDLFIGCGVGTPQDEHFRGVIDELRLWNRPLKQADIRKTMYERLKGDEAGLIGYWRFDEGEGQKIADASVSVLQGTLGDTEEEEGTDPQWVVSGAPLGGAAEAVERHKEMVRKRHGGKRE